MEKKQSLALALFFPPKLHKPLTTFYGYITNDKARQTFPSQLLVSLFLLGAGNVCWFWCPWTFSWRWVKFQIWSWPPVEPNPAGKEGRQINRDRFLGNTPALQQPNAQALCELSPSRVQPCPPIPPCYWASVAFALVALWSNLFWGTCKGRICGWKELKMDPVTHPGSRTF